MTSLLVTKILQELNAVVDLDFYNSSDEEDGSSLDGGSSDVNDEIISGSHDISRH